MMQTDEELVRLHRMGDKGAFPALVSRHLRSVYNLAYRSTGNVMEAENIVQETFVRAYAALPRCQEPFSFKPWLLTIAINLCRNRARQAEREPEMVTDCEGEENALEQVPDPDPGPLERLLQSEANAALEEAIAALPLPYRQALVLRYMEGLSYEEVAQALSLPVNTVRTHLFRAKERLREILLRQQERENDGLLRGAAAAGPVHRRATEPGRSPAGGRAPEPLLDLPGQGA